jgi:hypothetical protein
LHFVGKSVGAQVKTPAAFREERNTAVAAKAKPSSRIIRSVDRSQRHDRQPEASRVGSKNWTEVSGVVNPLGSLTVDPGWDPLRADPRVADLVRKYGFAISDG